MKKMLFLVCLLFYLQVTPALSDKEQQQVEDLRREGSSLFYQKRYQQAIERFKAVLRLAPDDVESNALYAEAFARHLKSLVLIDRAEKLADQGRYNQALQTLDESEKISPHNSKTSQVRQQVQQKKESAKPFAHLKPAQVQLFQKTLSLAQASLDRNENETALNLFARCLSLAPRSAEAAEGYHEAKKRHKAQLYHDKLRVLFQQAEAHQADKKYLLALAKYSEILRYDSANRRALEEKQRLTELVSRQKSKNEKKQLAGEYLKSGRQFFKAEKFNQAIEQFEQGKNILPELTDWQALVDRAVSARKNKEEKQFRRQQKELETNFRQGLLAIRSGNFDKAVVFFDRVVIIAKKYGQVETQKQAQELLRKATDYLARAEEEKVSQESPYFQLVQSLKALGIREYQQKNYKKAREYFSSILELFPKNREANEFFYQCEIELKPEFKQKIIAELLEEVEELRDKDPLEARRKVEIGLKIEPGNAQLQQYAAQLEEKTTVIKKSKIPRATLDEWYNQAVAQLANSPEKAKALCQKILKEDPAYLRAQRLLAKIEGRLSRGKWLTKSKQRNPAAARAYSVGLLHYNNGRVQKALNSFKRAVRLDPGFNKAKIALQKCQAYLRT